jgi:hypothetical protein
MVMDGRLAAGLWRAFTCCCLAGAMVALASLGAGKKGRPPKTLWQVLAHDSKYWYIYSIFVF